MSETKEDRDYDRSEPAGDDADVDKSDPEWVDIDDPAVRLLHSEEGMLCFEIDTCAENKWTS